MLLWFAGMSFLAVWIVFRDPAIDYRLVMVGALLPDIIDGPTGGRWFAHTLLFSVMLLAGVMLATRHRRLLRRQLLALPIGTFLHLVLDGMWTDRDRFWWPFFGTDLADRPLPSVERGAFNVVLELAGAAVLVWAWRHFRMDRRANRRRFLTSGRLPRDIA
jgi:membrane-bound metal-dependent hydrolase YbcI (DUF457 family)